jgi:hypothetical protein
MRTKVGISGLVAGTVVLEARVVMAANQLGVVLDRVLVGSGVVVEPSGIPGCGAGDADKVQVA